LHVSHPSGQFCLTLGGAKTFDKDSPFIKYIFTFCMRDRFKTPKARRLNSSLVISNRRIVVGHRFDVYCYEECFSSQI
jgi:hypothetical protein